jgi:broad specificity phosphatase PhoE
LGDLYVIRHAQASFGQADYDRLSELGFRQARLLEVFLNRSESGSGKTVALVTSGGPLSAILKMALSLSDREMIQLSWQIRTASVSTFKYNRERLMLASFNNVAHLEMTGGPELLTYR